MVMEEVLVLFVERVHQWFDLLLRLLLRIFMRRQLISIGVGVINVIDVITITFVIVDSLPFMKRASIHVDIPLSSITTFDPPMVLRADENSRMY